MLHYVECFFEVKYHSMCCLFSSAVLANPWNVVQSCLTRHTPPKFMLSDVEEVIQFLVDILEYKVFHHFTWNTGE